MATSAQDNAYAERINRTIKEEYLNYWKPKNFKQLKKMIQKAVNNYNTKRIHNTIDRKKPVEYRTKFSLLTSQQRKTIIIFNNEIVT